MQGCARLTGHSQRESNKMVKGGKEGAKEKDAARRWKEGTMRAFEALRESAMRSDEKTSVLRSISNFPCYARGAPPSK